MQSIINDAAAGTYNGFVARNVDYFSLDVRATSYGSVAVQIATDYKELRGTHTGSNGASTLTDSTASFTVDDLIGSRIDNVTDGSSVVITDNTATTVTGTLAGGTDDDWDAGDEYVIRNGNWHPYAPGGTDLAFTADTCETYNFGGAEFRFVITGGSGYSIDVAGGNVRTVAENN